MKVSLRGFLLLFVASRLLYLLLIDPSYLLTHPDDELYVGTIAQELVTGPRLIEGIVELHGRGEGNRAFLLLLVIGGQVKVHRPVLIGHHLLHEVPPDEDEPDPGKALDALARGAGDHPDVAGIEIDLFPTQAADTVQQQEATGFLGDRPDLLDGVEHAGGRLVVHHADHVNRPVLTERDLDRLGLETLIPLAGNVHILHLVRVRDRGDPLRVHAILDDQDAAPRRQTGGDGRLHSRRARPGQEDGHEIPTGGERPDELIPDALDQVVEFCL